MKRNSSGSKPSYKPDFARYEREKKAWTEANPKSTPEQYQQAMMRIAQQCGI
jgi:hypothetical protein